MDDPPDPAPATPTVFYGLFPRWTAGSDEETELAATFDTSEPDAAALQAV